MQASGKKVFPDFNTMWHFDDKVGQKYLLEIIGAPLVPTWVFYDKHEALSWVDKTDFPKVFKLRGGAGSANVQLAHTKREAVKLIRKAFGRGFSQYNALGNLKERIRFSEQQLYFGFHCAYCDNPFILPERLKKQRLAQGTEYAFCSRSCSAKFHNTISSNSSKL